MANLCRLRDRSVQANLSANRENVSTFIYTGLLCLGIALLISALTGSSFGPNAVVSFSIGWSINLSFVLFRDLLGRWLHPYLASIPLTALGLCFGLIVGATATFGDPWVFFTSGYETLVLGVFFGVVGFAIFSTRGRLNAVEAELAHAEAERERQEKLLMQTELRLLQAQIEPHFLFNTLSNIAGLIHKQPDAAESTLLNLTTLLRATLKRTRQAETSLGEEIEIARAYLEIQAIRMQGRLQYEIHCDASSLALPLQPLLVQPLVENAIKHGIDPCETGGTITIDIKHQGDMLTITVTDTGCGVDSPHDTAGTGTGLKNVRERLQGLYGDSAQLLLTDNEPRGMIATLHIPVEPASA
jgi:signal transduction histidine kinase